MSQGFRSKIMNTFTDLPHECYTPCPPHRSLLNHATKDLSGNNTSLTPLCQTVCSFSYIKNNIMNLIWFAVWCQMFDDQHFP